MRWLGWTLVLVAPLAVAMAPLREVAPWCPLLPWAVVAWMVAASEDAGVPWRALAAGFLVDAVDPASTGFHSLAFVAASALGPLLRPWLFPGPMTTAGVAMAGAGLIAGADAVLGGWGGSSATQVLLTVVLAGPAAVLAGWLLDALPPWADPLARRPRTAPA
jgi:cell shape-determining protein MreD